MHSNAASDSGRSARLYQSHGTVMVQIVFIDLIVNLLPFKLLMFYPDSILPIPTRVPNNAKT